MWREHIEEFMVELTSICIIYNIKNWHFHLFPVFYHVYRHFEQYLNIVWIFNSITPQWGHVHKSDTHNQCLSRLLDYMPE